MSLISKLTTLGAAGVGGDSYWIFQSDLSSVSKTIYDLDTDTQNNVVFSGYTHVGSDRRGWVVKIDPDGNLLWSKYLDSSAAYVYAYGVTTDSNDNVISLSWEQSDQNYHIVSLNSSGSENWKKENGAGREDPQSIASDENDNLYSYGWSERWSNGRPDTFALKHNSSGTLQWKLWSGDNTNSNIDNIRGYDIANIPSSSYMAVCGWSDKRTTGSTFDAFIGMISKSNGYPNFIRVLYHSSGSSRCMGVAADSSGNIYGLVYQSSSGAYIAKYSLGGVFQWLKKITASGSTNLVPAKAIAVDSNDNIFVAWGFYPDSPVMKLDSSGNMLASIYISDGSYINLDVLEIDGNDNIIVSGYGDGLSDRYVFKLPNDLTSVTGSYSVDGGTITISTGSATSTTSSDLTSTSQSFNSSQSPNAGETFVDTTSQITTGNVSANETLTEM